MQEDVLFYKRWYVEVFSLYLSEDQAIDWWQYYSFHGQIMQLSYWLLRTFDGLFWPFLDLVLLKPYDPISFFHYLVFWDSPSTSSLGIFDSFTILWIELFTIYPKLTQNFDGNIILGYMKVLVSYFQHFYTDSYWNINYSGLPHTFKNLHQEFSGFSMDYSSFWWYNYPVP